MCIYNQNRLRRGEVEPKPTPVALSPENFMRSSTGESEGYSDYDNSASYEDTDGDTDGERLVTNKQVQLQVARTNDDVCKVCSKCIEMYCNYSPGGLFMEWILDVSIFM